MNRTENSSILLVAMFGSWPKKKNIETEISEKILRNNEKRQQNTQYINFNTKYV